ncbi:hypothetical protein C4K19_3049 [Pseudomonas chlororaphis subsp. aurantiaca]|nr:hypothetical protein C4K19_3049 [Pseudomonas chlororaphis subsp. aurantiaca]AZD79609.1 hypothetical protein C4K15_3042 [Pseudomonas chlororaphis subsp. aurantiaca]
MESTAVDQVERLQQVADISCVMALSTQDCCPLESPAVIRMK